MTTTNLAAAVASTFMTDTAREALSNCHSLRNMHDVSKSLIKAHQLGFAFDPKRNNAFEMPLTLIFCRAGDSIRKQPSEESVRGFADAYKAGKNVPALSVVAENGMLRVVGGFSRYAGLMLAVEEGAAIQRVWVQEIEGGRRNELAHQLVSDNGEALPLLDRASAYRELVESGCSIEEICELSCRNESHVRKMLDFESVDPEAKAMVESGQASISTVVKAARMCKADGTSTVVHLKDQLAKAQANGSNKITAKSTSTPIPMYNRKDLDNSVPLLALIADELEKVVPFMGQAPEQVTVQLTLNGDLQALLMSLANLRAVHASVAGSLTVAKAG